MLALDSDKLKIHAEEAKIEQKKQKMDDWLALEEANCVFLHDPATDPTLPAARMGRMLRTAEFERKLKKIFPAAIFHWDVYSDLKKKKLLLVQNPEGDIGFSLVYESDFMPERSIMCRKVEDVIDPRFFSDPARNSLKRQDLPKHEFVPGYGYVFDKSVPMPGTKRIERPWNEVKRGWRAVLLRLIKAGYITPTQAEREFYGPDSTPEWQGHLGRTPLTRPW